MDNHTHTRIEVRTVFGTLFAEIGSDPDSYPGICICTLENDENGNEYERQIVIVEATPSNAESTPDCAHTLRALVWSDGESGIYGGDPSHDVTILVKGAEKPEHPFVQLVTHETHRTVTKAVDEYCLHCSRGGEVDRTKKNACESCPVRRFIDSLKAAD